VAIDDPVGIVIKQVKDDIEAESQLATRLVKLGLSVAAAAALAKLPFVSHMITRLLATSSLRTEKRLLLVAEALNSQQKRIEDKIPDRTYYESEEFQTLLGLLLERLHTTHDNERLRMYGIALGNSGSSDFREDPREEFIRILRDLSLDDLRELMAFAPPAAHERAGTMDATQRFRLRRARTDLTGENLSRTTRLIGLGLVTETLSMRDFRGPVVYHNEAEIRKAITEYLERPPVRVYELSWFGWRFLQFIAVETQPTTD